MTGHKRRKLERIVARKKMLVARYLETVNEKRWPVKPTAATFRFPRAVELTK